MHIIELNVENVPASVTVSMAIKAHGRHQRRQWGVQVRGVSTQTEIAMSIVQKLGLKKFGHIQHVQYQCENM